MRFLLSTLFILSISALSAQINDEVLLGAGYATQSFYSMSEGEVSNVSNTDWDIAFLTDAFNSSIRINDNTGTEAYLYSNDPIEWATVDTAGFSFVLLDNSEDSWQKGALVQPAVDGEQFDYGWGQYNFITHIVTGNRIFIVKLSSGDYKKVFIETLDLGSYTFKYANLDGSNEVSETVNSTEYSSKKFWYYSMQTQSVIDREPAEDSWDITFTRYRAELFPGFNYLLSGVQQNDGVIVAEARNVATDEAAWTDYPMTADISEIGGDWKEFDMDIFQFVIEDSLSYFVQDIEGSVWQLIFTGFGGTTTGSFQFSKELMSVTSLEEEAAIDFTVFPNPSSDFVEVIVPVSAEGATYSVVDMQGKTLINERWSNGLQHRVDVSTLDAGIYLLQVQVDGRIGIERIVKK